MTIDFYYMSGSAPCRSVLLVAKALGLQLNLKETNPSKKETTTPEFLKMNPQHTIPTISDDGFCLWESRAILGYLVDQYCRDDSLYPKDPKQRALVDQRLYFDALVLYQSFGDVYYPILLRGASMNAVKYEKLEEAFRFLNKFLEGRNWAAGSNMTIADLALVASVSTIEAVGFPIGNYRNVKAWYERVQKTAPGYEVNTAGADIFKQWYLSTLKK